MKHDAFIPHREAAVGKATPPSAAWLVRRPQMCRAGRGVIGALGSESHEGAAAGGALGGGGRPRGEERPAWGAAHEGPPHLRRRAHAAAAGMPGTGRGERPAKGPPGHPFSEGSAAAAICGGVPSARSGNWYSGGERCLGGGCSSRIGECRGLEAPPAAAGNILPRKRHLTLRLRER